MKRFLNSVVALIATFVAYQLYALAVVPLVEPALPKRTFDAASEEDWQGGAHAVGRYQEMLRSYVPADHWALRGKPQVYEYGPMVFVLDDYRPLEGGRVVLTDCLVVVFPTPRVPGKTPPRDAILIEPPPGATIQFDEFDESPDLASSRIGRPVAGVFPGELVIRSDMGEPGPQDDLRIVTRDLRFNQSMFTTDAEVDLRFGKHRGRGRILEVRLVKDPDGDGGGAPIAGVESLEVREDVRVSIDMTKKNQPPRLERVTARPGPSRVRLASATAPVADGPLDVTSAGPFRFDFTRFVASFQDDVRATLRRPGVGNDELRCRELRLHFADKKGRATTLNPADEPDMARRQGKVLSALEPHRIEALGSPVRLDSPSRQAAVRGRLLKLWLRNQRLRMEGTPDAPATIAYGLSQAQAIQIDYRGPTPESGHLLGDLTLSGAGWLRATPSPDAPERTYRARWSAQPQGAPTVTLRRDKRGQPLLSIVGRPEFAAAGFGTLRADRVVAHLSEVAADGPRGPAVELGRDGAVIAKRVDALGSVEFVGREIEGRADRLVASLRPVDLPETQTASASGWGATAGGREDREPRGAKSAARYRLATRAIQLDIGLTAQRATPLSLLCTGGVRLEEAPDGPGDEPLRILGEQLRVDRLERRGGARLTIAGSDDRSAAAGDQHEGLAEIRSRGLRVWVRDLHIDQAAGRAWTEGRGDAILQLPASRSAASLGGEATLRWRGGMEFDGTELAVSDEVFAEATGGWINCTRLAARLSSPVDLRSGRSSGPIDVDQVECSGGVTIDYRSTDEAGQRSHERARLASVAVNQRTGAIAGSGPGSVRSVHLGGGSGPLGGSGGGSSAGGLRFLRVDFRDSLAGNVNDRALRFVGDVQTVYGPVLAWDHQLPLASPEGVPPDAMELRCVELRVHEDPASSVRRGPRGDAPLGPIELRALRDVRIDASVGDEGGSVVAEAAAATYSQSADRFILEGDGRGPAKLWYRPDADQPYTPSSAQRLVHHRGETGSRTSISDFGGIRYEPPPRTASPASRLR